LVPRTFTISMYKDTPIKIHWSFILLLLYVLAICIDKSDYTILFFMATLFISVVVHELGHLWSAEHHGIATKDIIISPIGGVARLKTNPLEPRAEMKIAFAGPLANLVLACILFLLWYIKGGQFGSSITNLFSPYYSLYTAAIMNLCLFLFNLIPAHNLDGGRILKSVLTLKYGASKSIKVMHILSVMMALVCIILGLVKQEYWFVLLGIIIIGMLYEKSISFWYGNK
jgi:Zn-dependent protease